MTAVPGAGLPAAPGRREGVAADTAGADAAISRVLAAEREAKASMAHVRQQAEHLTEAAATAAAALARRTERRQRALVAAFERELALQLADIEAEAARLTQPHRLTPDEQARLQREVQALARELIGAPR